MTLVIFAIILFLPLGDPVFSCSKSGHRDIGKFLELYIYHVIIQKSFCIRYQHEDGFNIYMSQ